MLLKVPENRQKYLLHSPKLQQNSNRRPPSTDCKAEAFKTVSYPSLIRWGFLACITINANVRFITASVIKCKMKPLSLKTVLQKAVIYLDGRHVTFKTLKQERVSRETSEIKNMSMIDALMMIEVLNSLWLVHGSNEHLH